MATGASPGSDQAGKWLAVGVGSLALTVYILALAPGLTFEHSGSDGGDLITAAWTLGVPHPPGYPLYTLLAWLFTRLPVGTIAYRVNLLSAVCAAGAVTLVCRTAQMLLPREAHRLALSAAAALTLAFSSLLWSQAVISEVYALLTLLAALVLWLVIHWRNGGRDHDLWLAGLTLGLGMGNHLTLAFVAPAIVILLWPQRRRWFRARTLLPAIGLFLAGLTIYAYLPLAAAHRPPVNWGDPRTWKGFLWVISGEQYQAFVFGLKPDEFLPRLGNWALLLGNQFGWWGLLLALIGIGSWWRRDRLFVAFAFAWMLPLGIYAFFYDTGDSYVYLLPAVMLLALFWGEGARYLLHLARHLRPVWQRTVLVVILLLPLASLALHWKGNDLSRDWQAHAYAFQALESADPGSLIVVRGDRSTFSLWYGLYAEGLRPDVTVVNGPMLAFIWYRNHIRHLHPDLILEDPTGSQQVTWDDLVRDLIVSNYARQPVYAADPKEPWEEWFEFTKEEDDPLYRVQPKPRWEQQP